MYIPMDLKMFKTLTYLHIIVHHAQDWNATLFMVRKSLYNTMNEK